MEGEEALDFYDRITSGKKRSKTISLEHSSGATLDNVEMRVVSKRTLARIIERLPDEMFEAVEDAEDAEAAEAQLEEEGGGLNAVTEETVGAFEDLVAESLNHPELTKPQMQQIVSELNFETLFALGTEVINISMEQTGAIRDFHEQA